MRKWNWHHTASEVSRRHPCVYVFSASAWAEMQLRAFRFSAELMRFLAVVQKESRDVKNCSLKIQRGWFIALQFVFSVKFWKLDLAWCHNGVRTSPPSQEATPQEGVGAENLSIRQPDIKMCRIWFQIEAHQSRMEMRTMQEPQISANRNTKLMMACQCLFFFLSL